MAEPTLNLEGSTFVFLNEGGVRIAATTDIVPPESVTVESVKLTNHHGDVDLPITDLVVPPPVVEHLFDLLPNI
jgi:hypothetical protein